MAKTETQTETQTFGPNNLRITDGTDKVQIEFDPKRIIGAFNPSKKALEADENAKGNPRVCSTGSYRILDISGVKVMLHVIGRSGK
jgi:hypothetical protein